MGFEVQLSEHTDFDRRPEIGAFDACFEAVRGSDFYLLLIGDRRGAWYDELSRISVTRQEYRVALESFESVGKPRIVALARAEVLTVLRERRALGSPKGRSTLEDWQFTADFVREVRREDEVADAAKGSRLYPAANWLSQFRDFRELVGVLRSTLAIAGPLPRAALLETVRRDCEQNLRVLLSSHRGRPFWELLWLSSVRKEVVLSGEHFRGPEGTVQLTFEQMKRTIGFLVGSVPLADRFQRVALDQIVSSGALLDYDPSANRFTSTPVLEAIYRLREELDWYTRRAPLPEAQQTALLASWEQSRAFRRDVLVNAFALLALFAVHDTLQNIARLSLAILRYLRGQVDTVDVQLRPSSPVAHFAEEIQKESVSEEQLRNWLDTDDVMLRIGVWEETEAEREQREATEKRLRELLGDEVFDQFMSETMDELTKAFKAQNEGPEVSE